MIAIIVVNIPFFARGVRGGTLVVVTADFMAAARLSGLSDSAHRGRRVAART